MLLFRHVCRAGTKVLRSLDFYTFRAVLLVSLTNPLGKRTWQSMKHWRRRIRSDIWRKWKPTKSKRGIAQAAAARSRLRERVPSVMVQTTMDTKRQQRKQAVNRQTLKARTKMQSTLTRRHQTKIANLWNRRHYPAAHSIQKSERALEFDNAA